ncbi:MAG: GH3 auxin-responsive promoter family protein [Oscillospiraceae bacterium]
MHFEEKLKSMTQREIWEEYCGFLDMSIDEYMAVQKRLLEEQLHLMSSCALGKRFFGENPPTNMEEFRKTVPLTQYEDYADILLRKREDMLPVPPVLWLETTWEGGDHPFKCAPYTQGMLDTYRTNILSAMIMSCSRAKGTFKVRPNAKVLYSLAPLPYATGLFPGLVDPEIKIKFLPPLKDSKTLSFSQRCKKGFKMSLKSGMNQFYGMTSIVYSMSKSFNDSLTGGKGGLKDLLGIYPNMLWRLLRAKYLSKRDERPICPGDLFHLDGFVCVGTDTALYKDELEKMWNCRPLEVAGGTEPCLLGTETWQKNGLVFFPDNCFYEFITELDMLKNLKDPSFIPPTYLMNELVAGEKYELVITVLKGGAFMRYRVGDVYRCIRTSNRQDGLDLPQFEYIDRIPTVIDIDGFTRITRREIERVIELSGLAVNDFIAAKEYDEGSHSFLHMYVEMDLSQPRSAVVDAEIFKNHLSIYFRYLDSDYGDLKRLIGVDPLEVTMLQSGTIAAFERDNDRCVERICPRKQDILDLLAYHRVGTGREVLPR